MDPPPSFFRHHFKDSNILNYWERCDRRAGVGRLQVGNKGKVSRVLNGKDHGDKQSPIFT